MRLIDADALKRDICKYCNDVYSDEPCEPSDCEHMRIIDNQPTIDAVEVVHGRWEEGCWCSVCHRFSVNAYIKEYANYCPNCGAKMDGERKNDGK